ncbi:helix-turn-helix domain-containing protein [Kitasatospora sp. MAA19]|uniref:ArsR/SmtB family transcription factor n=1 Tax=Kitasatospora sp. MAA19 TaxID=3035090 RepID=UPI0024755FC9|nr:helix-turn-helix domain-containing protein [Kitasatospora sp. MAA19]
MAVVAFGARDLANVRFAISPIQHLVIGLQQDSGAPLPARRWWRSVRSRVPGRALPLIELVAAHPLYLPDFLTPPIPLVPGGVSIADELDVISAVSTEQVHGELCRYAELGPTPRPVAQLLDGGSAQVNRLIQAVHALYRACLADDWPDMVKRLNADISMRRGTLGDQGTGRMLADVHQAFSDPTRFQLTLQGTAPTVPEHLKRSAAAGFVLSPNLFLGGMISPSIASPWQQPLFAYTASEAVQPPPPAVDGLTALIGKGKAAALRAIGAGCTTTELAVRLGVSAPAASQHTATLRAAGMITSIRDGQCVVHTLTPLGTGLLTANPL